MNRFVSRLLVGGGLGLGLGLLMALPLFFALELSRGFYEILNAPALWLAHSWTDAGLPPRGEIAWVVVPATMIVLQWSVVGAVLGLFSAFMPSRKSGKNENEVV
jgi:ABC-type antimicrobial peptide transport system permease subunit